uniref:Ice-binding protein C-terminal domain-containing protein n=1 Tax=Geobacter sp. (strain M21) TaxID=443144 RepID=C6DYU4_GEOSM
MKTRITNMLRLSFAAVAALAIAWNAVPAGATFVVDPNPGGTHFYLNNQMISPNHFTGNVGGNGISYPAIDVVTMGAVTVANGYSNIKAGTDLLTSLTFTPVGEERYGDFSFRGQLEAAGAIQVNVTNQNGINTGLTFNIPEPNGTFERIGIASADGDWIDAVNVSFAGGFEEIKQIDFSPQAFPVPEPSTFILLAFGLAGVGLLKKRNNA